MPPSISALSSTRPQLNFAVGGWHLNDIYKGLNGDVPRFFATLEQVPVIDPGGGDFLLTLPHLQGGATAIFKIAGSRTLELLGAGGAPLPSTLRVEIFRRD